jgi:NAD+ kinase
MIEKSYQDQHLNFYLYKDKYNESRSDELFKAVNDNFNITNDISKASAVIVIGGDGTLLKVTRHPILNKLPILALNGGTVGKNLIDVTPESIPSLARLIYEQKCKVLEFPMIQVEAQDQSGRVHKYLAFNDVFVDRYYAHTVKYTAQVNTGGQAFDLTDSPISGDGILISTPVGSTGYARVISEMILPLHQNTLLVCPMASMVLSDKRKVHGLALVDDESLEVKFIDSDFRPARLAIDGAYIENEDGNFMFVTNINFSIAGNSNTIKLLSPSKNNFIKKQIDFIAR